jgi:hypothetical protein
MFEIMQQLDKMLRQVNPFAVSYKECFKRNETCVQMKSNMLIFK